MNCIDAIEGAAKSIIVELFKVFSEERPDDTEYIRNIKAVIGAMEVFTNENKEVVSDPQVLNQVLYDFSKRLWLDMLETHNRKCEGQPEDQASARPDDGYEDYYFDYIYKHGEYPRGDFFLGCFKKLLGAQMTESEDSVLKAEIEQISKRIDAIVKQLEVVSQEGESQIRPKNNRSTSPGNITDAVTNDFFHRRRHGIDQE